MMKKILSIITLLCLAFTSAWADYSGSCGTGVTYNYVESTHTLTISGSGEIGTRPWVSYAHAIKTIVIENGVASIVDCAFQRCYSLTSIAIPSSVSSIGNNAFAECYRLTSIAIPSSVSSIGNNAFAECYSLTFIAIPSSVKSIGEGAFNSCSNLATVTVYAPSCTLVAGAFSSCRNLTKIYVPRDNVNDYSTNWDSYASKIVGFDGSCGDSNVNDGKNVIWAYDNGTLTISGTGAMADYDSGNPGWYKYRDNITSIVIEDGVTHIGADAFKDCNNSSLTSVTVCATACTLGNGAFAGCASDLKIYVFIDKVDYYKSAENWSDYASNIEAILLFQLTKNAGTESESITYYPTLGGAVNAAADGDKITLLKDYTITVSRDFTTTDTKGVSINKSITLDLNDHKITRDNSKEIDEYRGVLISIDDCATLTLVDNGADKGTMGSIENIDFPGVHAIVVGKGTLIAKGVLTSSNGETVHIDDSGTAVIDDCVIEGDGAITLYGTATITNSDISARNKGPIRVGAYFREDDDNYVIHTGHLTIGDGVYMSSYWTPPYIDYVFGTVIFKALPTFGQKRPTTSSTTRARAKTREGEYYDIGMRRGLSLTFEKGTFKTPDHPMIIRILDNDGFPVDPATYTNPITTNYSKYVKGNDDKVIDQNKVFKWEYFDKGFRMNTAGEVISNHAAATVTSYSGTSTPTITPYYNFSEAIADAKSGYKTASEAGGTEFIPEIKLLDNIDLGGNQYTIGENSKSWVKLDLNGKRMSGNGENMLTVGTYCRLDIFDTSTGDTKGSLVSNYEGTNSGQVIHVYNGELTATGITILGFKLTGIYNEDGEATLTDCTVSGCYGIYSSGTVNISGGKISGCSVAGIKLQTNNNLFTALPTFGTGDDKNGIDIWLANSVKMNFSEGSYTAPDQPITIKITIDSANEPTADDLPKQFTTGYADNFKNGNTVIDPATVFAYHDASLKFVIGSNDSGEAAVFATMTFAFAEDQTWMTWCDKYAWIKPSGIDVYEITNVTATEITTTKLTDDDVIPTYRPLLLMKNGADGLTAMSIGSPEAPTTGYDATTGIVSQTFTAATVFGATKGVDADATEATYILGRTYMLLYDEFIPVDKNEGFAQNRCWLTLGGAAGARRLAIVNGEATGVSGVKEISEAGDDSWYTATGRRLERRPVRKGIYIHGGQKMIIK